MTPDDVTFLPRWICGAAFGLGVLIRKTWLYVCAPIGMLFLIALGVTIAT